MTNQILSLLGKRHRQRNGKQAVRPDMPCNLITELDTAAGEHTSERRPTTQSMTGKTWTITTLTMILAIGAMPKLQAQIDPRRQMAVSLAASGSTAKTQDDGFGVCPAFTHFHPYIKAIPEHGGYADNMYSPVIPLKWLDGLCHRDDDDSPIKERPRLPKPQFKPDPKSKWS